MATQTKKSAHKTLENTPPLGIQKPDDTGFDLGKFKSQSAATIAGVETLPSVLPVQRISDAKDFVRLHPDDAYWSAELCFVNVPIKGAKKDTLHLIVESLALAYLPSGQILHFVLALAAKPNDSFFLAMLPTRNLDNTWHITHLQGAAEARGYWVRLTSRKEENIDGYKIDRARDEDAFPEPRWPVQSLGELIKTTFAGRMIDHPDHPALLRLIGARQMP
jgi:hypothetical protein